MYETTDLGFNYRMSEIHAAIGVVQLDKLPDFLKIRKKRRDLFHELSQFIFEKRTIF